MHLQASCESFYISPEHEAFPSFLFFSCLGHMKRYGLRLPELLQEFSSHCTRTDHRYSGFSSPGATEPFKTPFGQPTPGCCLRKWRGGGVIAHLGPSLSSQPPLPRVWDKSGSSSSAWEMSGSSSYYFTDFFS